VSIIPNEITTGDNTPDTVEYPDALFLPESTLVGLTREQVAAIATEAEALANRTPRRLPPAWVVSGPDTEGNYNGPSGDLFVEDGDGKRWLNIHSAWNPDQRAVLWFDCSWESQDVTPAAARQFALDILRVVDAIEGDNGGTLPGEPGGADDDGDDDLGAEVEACEALASRLPCPRPAPRMRHAEDDDESGDEGHATPFALCTVGAIGAGLLGLFSGWFGFLILAFLLVMGGVLVKVSSAREATGRLDEVAEEWNAGIPPQDAEDSSGDAEALNR
jgi:hypothetical protein